MLDAHIDALQAEIRARGGLGGIALTHDHIDHAGATSAVAERFPGTPVAAARGQVDVVLRDGSSFGPLEALATPGHAPDHIAFAVGGDLSGGSGDLSGARGELSGGPGDVSGARGEVILTGDAVLGHGSVFITPYPGALTSYLEALERLRTRDAQLLGPGHGPVVTDVAARLEQYISHRLERERRLLAALEAGRRTVVELLADAWSDAPEALRPAAIATLAAHLDKLAEEGRLPAGVERPQISF